MKRSFYSGQEELSHRILVFKNIEAILEVCKGEFREGYWQEKPVKVGEGFYIAKTYIEDKRDAYINLIDNLYYLLEPHFDKKTREAIDKLEKEENDIKGKATSTKSWIYDKLDIRKRIFRVLNKFLYNNDYLKQQSFGDDGLDDEEGEIVQQFSEES